MTELTRLGRSARDLLNIADDLKRRGVQLCVLNANGPVNLNDPSQKFSYAILSAAAEFERDLLSQRIRDGIASAKRTAPEGKYRRSRHPKLNPQKIKVANDLLEAGRSQTEVARHLGVSRVTCGEPSMSKLWRSVVKTVTRRDSTPPRPVVAWDQAAYENAVREAEQALSGAAHPRTRPNGRISGREVHQSKQTCKTITPGPALPASEPYFPILVPVQRKEPRVTREELGALSDLERWGLDDGIVTPAKVAEQRERRRKGLPGNLTQKVEARSR